MDRSLFNDKNVIIQGITGAQGAFHTKAMLEFGTNIVAGTSPNKAGSKIENVPVYKNIASIQKDFEIDSSVIFVPAISAKSAILEAIDAKIPLIVCITEGMPIHDMLDIKTYLVGKSSTLIGPNCPGIIMPGVTKLGIVPADMALAGNIGVVSRSGTLTYEVMAGLSRKGLGQRYVIGIGGDPIRGTGFVECLELFQNDSKITEIVLIGEIGGTDELVAADYIQQHVTKPVYAYIAGHHAPAGIQLGHAGAILGGNSESASYKTLALKKVGAYTATNISDLLKLITGI